MRDHQLEIESVSPGSIGEELGIKPGDIIMRINDNLALDIIDYRFLAADEEITILLRKPDGDHWLLEIEKDWDEDLGFSFKDGGLGRTKNCRNKCVFCFVDQMPLQMRKSLYVKDDDYRLSFFQGNFVTLTNTSDSDLERIAHRRLSPLYVSVHTTSPELRTKMMKNPSAGKIMDQLKFLASAGIEIHTQAVLCPGINDSKELDRTINDLTGLWHSVVSLAVVPVGLTGHRQTLFPLRGFTDSEAGKIVQKVQDWQDKCIDRYGYPLVFASDEFYLLASKPIPSAGRYGGFPQTENGVGLIRLFMDDWKEIEPKLPAQIPNSRNLAMVTGKLAASVLKPIVERLNEITNLTVEMTAVENNFFGPSVTVAGLVTASDIVKQTNLQSNTEAVIIPGVTIRSDKPVFLDGPSIDDLACQFGIPVLPADNARELAHVTTGITIK